MIWPATPAPYQERTSLSSVYARPWKRSGAVWKAASLAPGSPGIANVR